MYRLHRDVIRSSVYLSPSLHSVLSFSLCAPLKASIVEDNSTRRRDRRETHQAMYESVRRCAARREQQEKYSNYQSEYIVHVQFLCAECMPCIHRLLCIIIIRQRAPPLDDGWGLLSEAYYPVLNNISATFEHYNERWLWRIISWKHAYSQRSFH